MITFLPYPDVIRSLQALDYRRLGKQRLESKQILSGFMPNHPCSRMWAGHHAALKFYLNENIKEWLARGYKNTMLTHDIDEPIVYPSWFGDDTVHSSHRSNLLRKDVVFYGKYGWTDPDNLPYRWPV